MQWIDIGVNLTHESFDLDRDQVVQRAREHGVAQMIVTGASVAGSAAALDLAQKYSGLYATAGVHPHYAGQLQAADLPQLSELLQSAQVVAVGECGLDYFRDLSPRATQRQAFAWQLQLAAECRKPVFLHQRDAHQDFVAVLREHRDSLVGGVAHCFTGQHHELEDYLALDLSIGITGWINDERRGAHLLDLVRLIPANRLLLETDAPYLLPRDLSPRPRSRRNEPMYLPHVGSAVAKARGETAQQCAQHTTQHARTFFGLSQCCYLGLLLLLGVFANQRVFAQSCPRPAVGSAVPEPQDIRSRDGVLQLDLAMRSSLQPDGSRRYCYVTANGEQSPTLRVNPGDLLVLHLKNELGQAAAPGEAAAPAAALSDPCTSGAMTATSTNLHFHGLTVPPVCHQDDVLKTSIQPGEPAFEYRFRIPAGESPGLYWYHPHIHGFSKAQVLGGASGALIVEGLERAIPDVAGLPERVLVVRDQDLLNPDAPPARSEPVVPRMLIDRDGDTANNGTGFGRPAKDLSLNFVPVPYPDYPPASIVMPPGQRQLWRVLNACALTYLNLSVLVGRTPQQLAIVAIDGVPVNRRGGNSPSTQSVDHIGVPPGARVEFIVVAPPAGSAALLVTRTVDTGQGGENDPNRTLATITTSAEAAPLHSILPSNPKPAPPPSQSWLGNVMPVRVRKLYFSEKLEDPNNPNSATTFYLTVDGQTPAAFDPSSDAANIVVRQGDVEDWIIENRSTELHAFHIHQIHFLLLDWSGVPVNEGFLRDTVNVPYYNARMMKYPSVRLRMDFRDPNSVGTFVYHCHLLEHEDGGMMGIIRVEPR